MLTRHTPIMLGFTLALVLSPVQTAWAGCDPSPQLLTTIGTIVISGLMGGAGAGAGLAHLDTRRQYIQVNATTMLEDLSIGGGDSIAELATLYGLSPQEHTRLAKEMRAHRHTLAPLLKTIHAPNIVGQFDRFMLSMARHIKSPDVSP